MVKKSKNSKKKRIKRNPKLIAAYLSLMVVFIAALLFSAWCRDQSRKINADIIKQTQKAEQLAEMQDRLKIELARLKSPRRISKIARDRLGLITPTPEQTIVLP
ncbi:MAG: cell division protein FtsL [bacterium]|nr:cell division protein FtsL [bacterium]